MINVLVAQTWPRERRALVSKLSQDDKIQVIGFETGKDKLAELFDAIRSQTSPFVVVSSQRGYRDNDTLGNKVHEMVCKTRFPSLTIIYARAVGQSEHAQNIQAIQTTGIHAVGLVKKSMVSDNVVSGDADLEHAEIAMKIAAFLASLSPAK
jgi:hypothetical protein